jgi:hypothetical protein
MPFRSPARRRYLVRLAIFMTVYVISLLGAALLIRHHLVAGALVWTLALLPGFAVVGYIGAIGLYILEQNDEFLRMLMVRQTLIATGFTLSVASVWGFLETFNLVGHVEAYWIVVLWGLGLPLGRLANRITHGTGGDCL